MHRDGRKKKKKEVESKKVRVILWIICNGCNRCASETGVISYGLVARNLVGRQLEELVSRKDPEIPRHIETHAGVAFHMVAFHMVPYTRLLSQLVLSQSGFSSHLLFLLLGPSHT